jgi:hypothetical protein
MVHMAQPPISGSRTHRVRGRFRAAFVPALTLAVVAAACADGKPAPEVAAGPASTVPPIDAPAPLPDTRAVTLAGVAGSVPPLEVIDIRGGDADLIGTVTGPDGPVTNGFVLLERFVGDRRASLTVRTDRQGRFRALKVYGGRYRIRAWRTPDMALTIPELRFIRDDGETTLDLTLTEHDGLTVQAVASATAPLVDQTVTVTALVTRRQVDRLGIVVAPAAEGESVDLGAGRGWSLDGPSSQTVGADGRASWTLTCVDAGPGRLEVSAGDDAVTISTACRAPVEKPEEPEGDPAPDPDFAVGSRFSPPFAPPLPAGRYEVVEDPGSCGISFERYVKGTWETSRRTATGTTGFEVPAPFRDVRVIGDSPPCLYERVS